MPQNNGPIVDISADALRSYFLSIHYRTINAGNNVELEADYARTSAMSASVREARWVYWHNWEAADATAQASQDIIWINESSEYPRFGYGGLEGRSNSALSEWEDERGIRPIISLSIDELKAVKKILKKKDYRGQKRKIVSIERILKEKLAAAKKK